MKSFSVGTYVHEEFGNVTITEQCLLLQKCDPDNTSMYVVHNDTIKKVFITKLRGTCKI